MPVYQLSDISECFQRLAMGDEDAFKTIFECYRKKVFGVAIRMLKDETEAEEIVQEVFLAIWMAKERLGNIRDPEAYLFTMAYNAIYASLKKSSRDRKMVEAIINRMKQSQETTDEMVIANETTQLINDAIKRLPEQQRMVYQLSKVADLSYDEIADQMHISRNTVRNHLAEAMKSIRVFLKKTALLFCF